MAENKFEAKLGLNTKEVDRKLKGAESKMKGFGKAIKSIGLAIAAAFSVNAIINFGKELIVLASKAEGVQAAFSRLDNPMLLNELRKATRGTVTDVELMTKAIQAKNFKIALQDLPTYFEFATKRAIQTGESVDYLVNSIITGIGRKSVLVMDNLGISAVELQEEVKKVGDFGIAAGEIIRRELTTMGDVADTTAIKIASIGTAWQNLKTGMGQKITDSPAFQGLVNFIDDFGKTLQLPGMTWTSALGAMLFKRTETVEATKAIEESITEEYRKQQSIIKNTIKIIREKPITKAGGLPRLSGLPGFKQEKGILSGGPPQMQSMIKDFSDMQLAVMDLSDTFAGFFTDVNLGFQGMIDGVITGIKRLVMELIAKAAFLAILSAITGVPLSGGMFMNMLGGGINTLSKGGALQGMATGASGAVMQGGAMQDQLVATLRGKDIQIALNRS